MGLELEKEEKEEKEEEEKEEKEEKEEAEKELSKCSWLYCTNSPDR